MKKRAESSASKPWLLWVSSGGALLIGLWLRMFGSTLPKDTWGHDLATELGIALVIAAVVTLLYEFHARRAYSVETVGGILRTVMGDIFDTQLWDEMKKELLSKAAIRRAFNVKVAVEKRAGFPDHIRVLKMTMSYRLASLRLKKTKIRVHHFVDDFMSGCIENTDLPKFAHITIGKKTYPGPAIGKEFKETLDLSEHADQVVAVEVVREELIYLPGAYNLLMSELTSLESVVVVECPSDVGIQVNCMFDDDLLTVEKGWSVNRMLLPGQAIEFRFKRIQASRHARPSPL